MAPDRYWELVALLEGVADDDTCDHLGDFLRESGEVDAFLEATQTHVARLLASCEVPPSHRGDAAEWLAAAVIATGRERYEQTLASAEPLEPGRWEWEEAEALLVVGLTAEEAPEPFGGRITLQWCVDPVPAGVTSAWEPFLDALDSENNPAWGRSVCSDPEWDAALAALDGDPSVTGDVHLDLVVRDLASTQTRFWPLPEPGHAVRRLPAAVVRAAASRADLYVDDLRSLAEWARRRGPETS